MYSFYQMVFIVSSPYFWKYPTTRECPRVMWFFFFNYYDLLWRILFLWNNHRVYCKTTVCSMECPVLHVRRFCMVTHSLMAVLKSYSQSISFVYNITIQQRYFLYQHRWICAASAGVRICPSSGDWGYRVIVAKNDDISHKVFQMVEFLTSWVIFKNMYGGSIDNWKFCAEFAWFLFYAWKINTDP